MITVKVKNESKSLLQLNLTKDFKSTILKAGEESVFNLADLRPEWKQVLASMNQVKFEVSEVKGMKPSATAKKEEKVEVKPEPKKEEPNVEPVAAPVTPVNEIVEEPKTEVITEVVVDQPAEGAQPVNEVKGKGKK